MRFFHLSDLHIGKQLHHYNLKDDQIYILSQVVTLAETMHPDAIIIAGDVYDKSVPSAEAVTIFDDFLTRLSEIKPEIPVLIVSGNHDNAKRLEYASGILRKHHIYLSGSAPQKQEEYMEKVTIQDIHGEVDVYLLPFFKPSYVRGVFEGEVEDNYNDVMKKLIMREEIDFVNRRNVLVSHQFYTGKIFPETCDSESVCVGGIDNIDISSVEDFDYVALGHLHGKQSVGRDWIRYCGTLLKYSVSEAGQEKTLSLVTIRKKGEPVEVTELTLKPLRDVKTKRGALEEIITNAVSKEREDYISVTLTDEVEPYHPKEQLQEVYDNILEIRIDNTRTKKKLLECEEEEQEVKSPMEAFCEFYTEMQGHKMQEEEIRIMRKIFDQIEEE